MTDDKTELQKLLRDLRAPIDRAELHGMITGLACAGGNKMSFRHQTYSDWLDAPLPAKDAALVETVFQTTLDSLWTYSDLDLVLMIPDDDSPIDARAAAVFEWCDGFLAGFGVGLGNNTSDLSPDMSEILSDMAEIARFEDVLDEDEANEKDLMEIVEFVRISAALVFAEHGKGPE